MEQEGWSARWRAVSEDVLTGMQEWRAAHPQATFAEIEAEVEAHLSRLRARLLEDAALASRAADVVGQDGTERSACAECGQPLQARGPQMRTVTVRGAQAVHLTRRYAVCPACGTGRFPPR